MGFPRQSILLHIFERNFVSDGPSIGVGTSQILGGVAAQLQPDADKKQIHANFSDLDYSADYSWTIVLVTFGTGG